MSLENPALRYDNNNEPANQRQPLSDTVQQPEVMMTMTSQPAKASLSLTQFNNRKL